jgi:hypothetical protein
MKISQLFRPSLTTSTEEQNRLNLERMLALAGGSQNPIFKAVLGYADEHARNEHEMALLPNLNNEQRQFNAGRSASAYDFAFALRDLQAKAEKRADSIKKGG